MYFLLPAATAATTVTSAAQQPAGAATGGAPDVMTFVLVAAVLVLIAGAGLAGVALRFVATVTEVVFGLGKSFISGISKTVALAAVVIVIVYLVQLIHPLATS